VYDGDKGSLEGAAGLQFGSSVASLSPVFNTLNLHTDIFNSTISTLAANNSGKPTNSVTVACLCEGAGRAGNNTDTVVVTPSVNLTISKTDGLSDLPAGTTTTYTITLANSGSSAANRAVLQDPVAPGLSCSTVSCSTTGATCPTAPVTAAALQAGLAIASFPANSSSTFLVDCAMTATGQ
jgi:large repetitive protein